MTNELFQQLMDHLPVEGSKRLERYLERSKSGNATDYRTPLYHSATRKDIINIMEKEVGFTEFEELTEIDQHEKDKIGPLSIMLPADERRSNLAKYWQQSWNPDETALSKAVNSVKSILPGRSLRPASLSTAFSLMPTDTNLGLPWFTRDRDKAGDYLQRASSASVVTDWYPCVQFWRGQSQGLKEAPKQRDVWGFDHLDTILCASILYPLLNALRQHHGFSAWIGESEVDDEISRIIRSAHGRRILSGDYSGFDNSIPRQLLDVVDDIFCDWFVESAHPRIRLLGEVCATIPIVVPYDVLDGRNGGMPSGHGLTNMKDTIANLIAIHYVALRLGCYVEDYSLLGDDFVVLFNGDWDENEFSKYAAELGLEASAEKQFISTTSVHFLQRWHSNLYERLGAFRGCHSPYRTLSGLVGMERWRDNWSKEMHSVRWIMQVEVCHNDPRHRALCQFLIDGDELLSSGVDPVMVFKRAGGAENIRSVLSLSSFPFNVKNPDKAQEFETTRIIRELQG